MLVQPSSIQHSTTYSAMCPAARPARAVAGSATFSASASFISTMMETASSAVSSLAAALRSPASRASTAGEEESPPPTGSRYAAAAAAVAPEEDPYDLESVWIPDLEVAPGPYSIRVPDPSGDTRCPRCRNQFLASGPTGYSGEQPICDLCLLEGSKPLGMVIALAAVARTFGAADPKSEEDYREASDELASFARLYEIVAAKSGPRRPFRLPANPES